MTKRRKFLKNTVIGATALSLPLGLFANKFDLPNVLIIGDSISMGYTPIVKSLLEGKANVTRPNGNCQGTKHGVVNIDSWLSPSKWDIIHFNFGLHDIKHVDATTLKNSNKKEDPPQSNLKEYKKNLKEITSKIKATGAKVIYATTTPFPPGTKPYREPSDAIAYNKVALKIMKKNKIEIDDLYQFVLPQMDALMRPVNVHFTKEGSEALAKQVSSVISMNLG